MRLLLALTGTACDLVPVDIIEGESRTHAFLAKNPDGRVPLLELDDGTLLPESNAILFYLAEGSPYLPDGRLARAQVPQWMFLEQYSHEPNIATSRFLVRHRDRTPEIDAALAAEQAPGHAALGVMEAHLSDRAFFVGAPRTIADLALYAYTHVAPDGGFSLDAHPAVRAWLERVPALPGYVPMRPEAGAD